METVEWEIKEFLITGDLPGKNVIPNKMMIAMTTIPFIRPRIPPAICSEISSLNFLHALRIPHIRISVRK